MLRLVIFVLLILPVSARAESHDSASPEIKAAITARISESVRIEPVTAEGFSRIFNAELFKAEVGMQGGGVAGFYIAADGNIQPVRDETGQQYLDYAALIKPEFRITSEADLLALREALMFFAGGSPPSPDVPRYGKYKDIWTVITGTFFDDYSGYVLWRKPGGGFERLEYLLKIPRDELTEAK